MHNCISGGFSLVGGLRRICARLNGLKRDRRGVVLLAVMVFVAGLLPLITLVLTSINTEAVSTAVAIKGAKADLASEKALNDAISLVVQEKAYPAYWTSVAQPNTAIIVNDPATGQRRNLIDDSGVPGAAGLDDVLGTDDDYWIGPRNDHSYIGTVDSADSSKMYAYDFRFDSRDGPTYIGQSWSFGPEYFSFAHSSFGTGRDIPLFNQFAAVTPDGVLGAADGVNDGYDPNNPFDLAGNNTEADLFGPGYYVGADEPRDPTGNVYRNLDPGGPSNIEQAMYNAKVNVYQSIYTDLDRGPIPSTLLKSYADVTDEAGRINLNIFCKKVPLMMPESADTDYDFDGYSTDDFNNNQVTGEVGWKWMDNPLFPDRDSTLKRQFNYGNGTFTNVGPIDWGRYDADPLSTEPFLGTPDNVSMPELGETVQHYYEGDTDGDGVPESVESMYKSLRMLMSIPGIDPVLAANILTYLNPPQDANPSDGLSRDHYPGSTTQFYRTLDSDYNQLPNDPGNTDPQNGVYRDDACNITPPLLDLDVSSTGGVVDSFRWDYARTLEDDMPLPPPRPLRTLDELLDVPGMTQRKFDRLKDYVTIFSYDTNVIATNVQDVGPNADMVNAYVQGDPQYNGALVRTTPSELQDTDDVADLRYDVDRFVFSQTMAGYRNAAEEMYAFVREHLPRTLQRKITLPVVDRMGRADSIESYIPNSDPVLYDLSNNGILLPSRDPWVDSTSGLSHPYNVGTSGHQEDSNGLPGAGYPALNPEFSLDSCLSIIMYRNGTLFEEDDYSYNPDGGAWSPRANRVPPIFSSFAPWLFRLFSPFNNNLSWILGPNNNPDPNAGFNTNPRVRPHGGGTPLLARLYNQQDVYDNLLNPGEFDSPADMLDVPLYTFGKMSVSLMADPPSDYRVDVDNDGNVDAANLLESNDVNYYISFSDVVDRQWYLENIYPDGPNMVPEGGYPNGDDNNQDVVVYEIRFTHGNRPGLALPDQTVPTTGDYDCLIPITPRQLRLVGGGLSGNSTQLTLVSYDDVNNLNVLGPDFTDTNEFTNEGGAGSLRHNYTWQDVPFKEDPVNFGSTGRPDAANDWPTNVLPPDAQAWAYDQNGDPYVSARVEVVRADGGTIRNYDTADRGAAIPDMRTDDVSRVYLQYNDSDFTVPLRVDLLPVRTSADHFQIRSSVGGYNTDGGAYLLYDWGYASGNDFPSGFDGTWPYTNQPGQAPDPRVIDITPNETDIVLRVYDLRQYADPVYNAPDAMVPPADGYPLLTNAPYNGVWDDGTYGSYGKVVPPTGVLGAPATPGFPSDGYPLSNQPNNPAGNVFRTDYAEAHVTVDQIADVLIGVEAQISAITPRVYSDESAAFRVSAAGGDGTPFTFRVRLYDPALGDGGGGPWQGPDGLSPIALFPRNGLSTSRITAPGLPYNPAVPALREDVETSYDLDERISLDATGIPDGDYWVEVAAWDNNGTILTDPADDYAYTKITIGGGTAPASDSVQPPQLNASINLRPLQEGGTSEKGFECTAAVDGAYTYNGNDTAYYNNFSYYWAVTRPVYSSAAGEEDVIVGEQIVDSDAPYVSIDADGLPSGPLTSSIPMEKSGVGAAFRSVTFKFQPYDLYNNRTYAIGPDGIPDANGVYFVHLYVMDEANVLPNGASPNVAHDVAMVVIGDDERTPMAVLHADRPGNLSTQIGTNSKGRSGANPPQIYVGGINPPSAAAGDVITIRGTNFDAGSPVNNIVRFAGDVEAHAFAYKNDGGDDVISVIVPQSAMTGNLNVTNSNGTSAPAFFQTGFNVTFDLIGGMATTGAQLTMDVDFQGDGHIDYSIDTTGLPNQPAFVRGNDQAIRHDYAADGFGNYIATLVVTDRISGRKQTSHQLITIDDLSPNAPANGMLANIWPQVDSRSETFTPTHDDGVSFHSVVDGTNQVVQRVWQVDESNTQDREGGQPVATGWADRADVLGRTLIDSAGNFLNRVQVGDLVTIEPGGAFAVVASVDSSTQLTLVDPGNPGLGLVGGTPVTRFGVVEANSATQVIDTDAEQGVPPIAAGPYDFIGNLYNPYEELQGGLLQSDVIAQYQNGLFLTNWVPAVPAPAPTPANPEGLNTPSTGILNVMPQPVGPGIPIPKTFSIAEDAPPAPGTGGNIVKNSGGFPTAGAPWVGNTIERYQGGLGGPLVATGTITNYMDTSHIQTDITGWQVGDGYRIYDIDSGLWVVGDRWQTIIPANQIRVGFKYSITRASTSAFNTVARSDGAYATEDAEVGFSVDMNFNFDLDSTLTNPTLVEVDWNGSGPDDADNDGDGFPDNWDVYPVGHTSRFDGTQNGLETESVRFRHDFRFDGIVGSPYNEYADPTLSGHGEPTSARYYVRATPYGAAPVTFGPYPLPVVLIGGDDYDLDLYTLNVRNWDNGKWHKVLMQAQDRADGYVAVDQMSIPPGSANYTDTMQTWVSYSNPVITGNAIGATLMRHQGVHGIGGALNWMSDANADTRWMENSGNESPLNFNPVNYYEFQFSNGLNQMNVPGGGTIKGLSFPEALPGIGRSDVGQFVYYRANRGTYNGYGFITDNLPPGQRTFSFDSQPLFYGDRSTGSTPPVIVGLAADSFINPQVGSSSQVFRFIPYVRGGAGGYSYHWSIVYEPGVLNTPVAVDPSGSDDTPYLAFIPQVAFSDELGATTEGTYRAYLQVTDSGGNTYTASRDFHVSTPQFQAYVMADPPSGAVGDKIQYHVYVEGGDAPYTIEIDYNEDDNGDGNKDSFAADETLTISDGNEATFSHVYSEPSQDWQDPDGGYEVRLRVTDDNGNVVINSDPGDDDTINTVVKIADVVPFNADVLVTPPSGVAPFMLQVNYSIAGGRPLSGGGYNVSVQLISTEGSVEGSETRTDANTFGGDGPDDPRLPNYNDNPVVFVVPAPGNYYVQLIATDNGGQMTSSVDDVFASGYMMPIEYGQPSPQVTRDRERRPMHAVRIWTDPYLDSYSDGTGGLNTGNYDNQEQGGGTQAPYGGRLMEADLPVLGDLFTTDPDPSFRSFGMYASKDPYQQQVYTSNYADAGGFTGQADDFYDTFTFGRVNINTASEQALTSLFMNIRKTRGYSYNVSVDVDGDTGSNESFRFIRNPAGDVYLSESEARQLAKAVVRYRTAFYDMYKPNVGSDEDFGYQKAAAAGGGNPDLGANFRVDHLPVIGPWDGVNPHVYSIDNRDAPLADCNADVTNTWDHMAASYYDFDGTGDMFYSPSDIAIVREPWSGNATVDVLGDGSIVVNTQFTEPASNYAKYLNDVVTNGTFGADRGNFWAAGWAGTGLYPDGGNNYSRWAFDARNYFTYDGGELTAFIDLSNPDNNTFNFTPGTLGLASDARNRVGIIQSNDEVAYSYIPNPPFRNLFDLYKVIGPNQNASPYPLVDNGGAFTLELNSSGLTPNAAASDYEVYSGPSLFRYVSRWDDETGEFIPIANYLDDIAPYVTCRSYVFRVNAIGAVTATGGSAGALVDTAKISRDRSRTAVIDTGPIWARRNIQDQQAQQSLINPLIRSRDPNRSYSFVWYKDESN